MINTNERAHFLARAWFRYPPMPQNPLGQVRWGRLTQRSGQWMLVRQNFSWSFDLGHSAWWRIQPDAQNIPAPHEVLQEGDWVAAKQTNENVELELLAPCRAPQIETQWTLETSRLWHNFTRALREFFHQRDFLETPTPLLVPCPGTEPFLEPFETHIEWQGQRHLRYLPFSPEFHLKKLLTLGWERVFELKPCFRNNELGPRHQPEFWMLEWYRVGANLSDLQRDVHELLQFVAKSLAQPPPPSLQVATIASLFYQAFHFDLTPTTSREELQTLAVQQNISVADDDTWDDLFFRLFLEKIEPSLGLQGPLVVCDYPPSQAALARVNERGWADRFEVYWQGLELANAFHELNDPDEQRVRFHEELKGRWERTGERLKMDDDFLQSLDSGLPPAAGIALGAERLFMAFTGLKSLEQVRPFPWRL